MAAVTSINLTAPRTLSKSTPSPVQTVCVRISFLNQPWKTKPTRRFRPLTAALPDGISEKVEKSIKEAEDTCSDSPESGECVAAWDEVEELSAAASHARDKIKAGDSDPLETYCKDNPETDECRTYDN